jgi:hypothetical protein
MAMSQVYSGEKCLTDGNTQIIVVTILVKTNRYEILVKKQYSLLFFYKWLIESQEYKYNTASFDPLLYLYVYIRKTDEDKRNTFHFSMYVYYNPGFFR